jgi:hypothetical protein
MAFEEFRNQVVNPVLGAHVVDGKQVGMIKRAENSGFLLEALQSVLVCAQREREDFDSDHSVKPGVARAVDLTHPARTQRRLDLVRPEFVARG